MSRGTNRERQVWKGLLEDGWFVMRSAGSRGPADLIALHAGRTPRMIQVKSRSTGGDFSGFPPAEREELRAAAVQAGTEAWLVSWPPHKPAKWIPSGEWPQPRKPSV